MKTTEFESLMRRSRIESELGDADYWAGFQRGLRRAYHGDAFGTAEEHAIWLSLADAADPARAELGRGYADGLRGQMPDSTDADRLRATLAALGLSQRGAARDLGLDERTVRRYCAGELVVPRVVWLALAGLQAQPPRPVP